MLFVIAIFSFITLIAMLIFLVLDLICFKKTSHAYEHGFFIRFPSSRKQIIFRFLLIEVILTLVTFICLFSLKEIRDSAVPNIEKVQTYEYVLTEDDYSAILNETVNKYSLNAKGTISFELSESDDIIIREYTTYTTYNIPEWKQFLSFKYDVEEKNYTISLPKVIMN